MEYLIVCNLLCKSIKMKIFLPAIILISFIASCKNNQEEKYLQLLKGDWKQDTANSDHEEFSNVFCFEDSLVSYDYGYEFYNFLIKGDTIFAEPYGTDFIKKKLQILSITNDTLLIKIIDGFKQNGDTLSLTKIKPKNNIIPSEIYYVSTGGRGGSGTCIKIDSIGNFLYYEPYKNLDVAGYSGTLSKVLHKNLLKKIHLLPLDSLKPVYGSYGHDDGGIGVFFKLDDKNFTSVTTALSDQPFEFSLFANYLFELSKRIELKKDTLVNRKYFSSKAELQGIYKGFDSLRNDLWKKEQQEVTASIKKMRALLPGIKDEKLRKLKEGEIALMEKAFMLK